MNCNLTKPLAPGDRQPDMPVGHDLLYINSPELWEGPFSGQGTLTVKGGGSLLSPLSPLARLLQAPLLPWFQAP